MKKLLFAGVVSALSLAACKGDDLDDDIAYSLLGSWNPQKTVAISGKDGSTLSTTDESECGKQSIYEFRSDNNLVRTMMMEDAANGCTQSGVFSQKYTYDNVNKILIISNVEYHDVLKLTNSELEYVLTHTTDINGDGFLDKEILYLTKK